MSVEDRRTAALFFYFQALDCLTTFLFVKMGIQEANPAIRWLIGSLGAHQAMAIKILAATLLFVLCCTWNRMGIAKKANMFFAGLAVWNLMVLLVRAR